MSRKLAIGVGLAVAVMLTVLLGFYLRPAGFLPWGRPLEKVTIGSFPFRFTGSVYIAQERGYFKAQGLDVTVKNQASSVETIRDLKAGRIDLACCGAFNLVKEVLGGTANLRCLAVLGNGQAFSLISRLDKGIRGPADLRGKTIGLMGGTAAEYFLGRFLIFQHIPFKEVTLVDVTKVVAEALKTGKIDAVMVPEPHSFNILRNMGNGVVSWPAQGGQEIYWVLATREQLLKDKPETLEKLLRALEQAVDFIQQNRREARRIIAQRGNFPLAEWDNYPLSYEVFLDQNLLLVLEDEAAWMIQNGLTHQVQIPNFLEYLAPGPLKQVNPKAVRLAKPGHALPE